MNEIPVRSGIIKRLFVCMVKDSSPKMQYFHFAVSGSPSIYHLFKQSAYNAFLDRRM